MSAEIFEVSRDRIVIAADTACSTAEKGLCGFSCKLLPLPAPNILVVGGNSAYMTWEFFNALMRKGNLAELQDVLAYAPRGLRETYSSWRKSVKEGSSVGAPIFIAGFEKKRPVIYMLGDRFDFEPQKISDCLMVTPEPKGMQAIEPRGRVRNGRKGFIDLMERQRKDNPDIGIGGEMVLAVLQDEKITTSIAHRFDNYEEIAMKGFAHG